MTHFYFIRHGEKKSSFGDSSLTPLGKKQAQETGKYLKQFPISKIISSPLKRTIQTAEIIAERLNLEYSLDENLAERMNWTDKGVSREGFLGEWFKSTDNRDYKPKYGESSNQTGRRMQQVVKQLAEGKDHSQIVLVTHNDATIDYLRNIFNEDEITSIKTRTENNQSYYQIMNCAITKVILNDQPHLKLLNFVDHLSKTSE